MPPKAIGKLLKHLKLRNGRVALIERPIVVCGQAQDPCKRATKVDVELSGKVRDELDSIDQRSQEIGRFGGVSSELSGQQLAVVIGAPDNGFNSARRVAMRARFV